MEKRKSPNALNRDEARREVKELRALTNKLSSEVASWERHPAPSVIADMANQTAVLQKENERLLGCIDEHRKEVYELVERVKEREDQVRAHEGRFSGCSETKIPVPADAYAQLHLIDQVARKVYDWLEDNNIVAVSERLMEDFGHALFNGESGKKGCELDDDGDGNCRVHPDGCPPGVAAFEVTGEGEKLVAATPGYKDPYDKGYKAGYKAGYNTRKRIDFASRYGAKKPVSDEELRKQGVISRKADNGEVDEERVRAIAEFQESKQSIIGVDCVHCGACCCPPAGVGLHEQTYVELNHADMVRLGSAAQMHMVKVPNKGRSNNSSGYFLQAYKDKDDQVRCPYFVGEVGNLSLKCGCGIYSQRPYACQVFEPGDEGCLIARRNHPRINHKLQQLIWRGKKKKSPRDKFYDTTLGESFETKYTRQAEKATDAALEDVSRGLPDEGEGGAEVCLAQKK